LVVVPSAGRRFGKLGAGSRDSRQDAVATLRHLQF
jgi:hypothetical protein